jgi:hypothetical protein
MKTATALLVMFFVFVSLTRAEVQTLNFTLDMNIDPVSLGWITSSRYDVVNHSVSNGILTIDTQHYYEFQAPRQPMEKYCHK